MLSLSCSNLIKQSAKQICFIRNKAKKAIVTKAQIAGNKSAEKNSKSEYKEMRGCYEADKFILFYCYDEIQISGKKLTFIEHKMANDPQEWYFHQCLLQCAFYLALALENTNTVLFTSKFYQKQGNPFLVLDTDPFTIIHFKLMFGKALYSITITDAKEIINFFIEKGRASLSYELAIEWDKQYKHKEYKVLSPFIHYQ